MTRKIVLSGGPHSGKTTLLESIRATFPQYEYIPEPATTVLSELQAQHDEEKHWRDIIKSPLLFCTLCMKQSILSEDSIDKNASFVFLDRCLIDTIAYSRRDGCEELVPVVRLLAEQAIYHTVFFCEPVGEIRNRVESITEAQYTHNLLRDAYQEMNVDTIDLPAVTTEERVDIVRQYLGI